MTAISALLALPAVAGELNPLADPAAVVVSGNARFTVLTPALIRMEWSPAAKFEDRASLAFINRKLPVPQFKATHEDGWLVLRTAELTLRYKEPGGRDADGAKAATQAGGGKFAADNLSIELTVAGKKTVWKPGLPDPGNLGGTTRTLDGVSGSCPIEQGLISRSGWALVDDSPRPLLDGDPAWATARTDKDALDWYFFGYGHDYARALRDFTSVAGRIPLPPRYAFGAWWSRYWAYSDAELRQLVAEFREHDVPLDVLVVDMDWHLDGWTGYTWNPKYFPDPAGFLKWVHDQGLRVTLNLHPADGVGKHEAAFADFAAAMGADPRKTERIPFAATDRRFIDAYFKLLHHPLERMGVDFWWMDWQQQRETDIPGLDPLAWLNYLHWTDMEHNPDRANLRPLIFSRWGGLGNHRYQIGFSGDTFCNWPSLAFQPFFTAAAGNVGYAFWSHDIGGHQPGRVDPELYVRWIQWGALSPALRTHTTKNPEAERRIWAFPEAYFHAAREAFRLRYALLPYIYTSARQCYDTGLPLCRPLYYKWPESDEAYTSSGEYLFGEQLLVAPVVRPSDTLSRCAETPVWLPPGQWTSWFTGQTISGPATTSLLVPLGETPLFVRSGGIIPTAPRMNRTGEKPDDPLTLNIFPGDNTQTRIYEDDGLGRGYLKDECAWTPIAQRRDGAARVVTIGPTEGAFPGMPRERAYEVRLRDTWPAAEVLVNGNPLPAVTDERSAGWRYDAAQLSVVIRLPRMPVSAGIEVTVRDYAELADVQPLRDGLRGQYGVLESIAALCGDKTPKAISAALEARQTLALQPRDALKIAREMQAHWSEYIIATYKAPLTDDVRNQAVSRLLGVTYNIEVVAETNDRSTLTASVTLRAATPFRGLEGMKAQLKLATRTPWKVIDPAETAFAGLSTESPLSFGVVIKSDDTGGLQTGVLRSYVTLTLNETPMKFEIEKVFAPSINNWWIVGPFDAPFEKGLATVFPPEDTPFDSKAEFVGKDGQKIAWRAASRPVQIGTDLTDEYFVHLHKFYGKRNDNAVAYAFTYLYSPGVREAILALGSDDGVAVWVNGREMHRNGAGRAYSPRQDRVNVRLNEGVNTLLVKINQGGGDWGFGVHVETLDGGPMIEVTSRLNP